MKCYRIAASSWSGSVGALTTTLVTIATTVLATAGGGLYAAHPAAWDVAAQYGSRLLRLFLGDRTTQLVLGMFVATFVYCIAAAPPFLRSRYSLKGLNSLLRWDCS